jgi:integrase
VIKIYNLRLATFAQIVFQSITAWLEAYRNSYRFEKRPVSHCQPIFIVGLTPNDIDRDLKDGPAREERKRQLRSNLSPLMTARMDQISRGDLQRIVDGKAAEGKIVMANRLRAALCAFTRWAFRRGHIDTDPGASVQKAGKETSRKRTPSLYEVKEIWAASFNCGPLWGPYFRMCILTGQRSRDEVLRMQWSWVNHEKTRLEIPTTKNGEPHIVHLSDPAFAELLALRTYQNTREMKTRFVFTTTGTTPASGVSRAKSKLEAKIAEARMMRGSDEAMEHWVLHDLRRSHATSLAEAGLPEGVVDRIQNHVAVGSRPSAVSAVYALAKMLPERARAMDLWARLVTEQANEVVKLHGDPTAKN